MRITVTPIGAKAATAAGVAAAVVNYLEGDRRGIAAPSVYTATGAAAYYADSVEGPGRWLGSGANFHGLAGRIDRDAFRRVLEGRHPFTGARLVTAKGSSQRRNLATGTAARYDDSFQALYDSHDVARLLNMTHREVLELIEAGRTGTRHADDRGWLATSGPNGEWISEVEVARHLELEARPDEPAQVLAAGDPDELLTSGQAARLLGVTPRYVRRLCADAQRNRSGRASLPSIRVGEHAYTHLRIRRADVAEFARRRKPPVARVGYDVTVTCEKSVGVLMMLANPEHRAAIVGALRTANDTAIAHLDRFASTGRRKGQAVNTEGLVVGTYFHGTSRALDPHPHHHNVVANAVVDEHGDVRALDARALYRHAPAAAALATAALRWDLRYLGVGWRQRDNGVWEIAGVSEAVIQEFSQRRSEMDEVRNALEARLGRRITHAEEDNVAVTTRDDKQAVDPATLLNDWRRRAQQHDFDPAACFDRADRAWAFDVLSTDLERRLFTDLVDPERGLCANDTRFDRADVLAAIVDWTVADLDGQLRKIIVPPQEIERLADRFTACDLVVQLDPSRMGSVIRRKDGTIVDDGQHEPVFTSVELLRVEAEILERHHRGRCGVAGVVAEPALTAALAADDRLSEEQIALVRAWCTSGDRLQPAVGRAGTGKTTTMRVAGDAWRRAGFRVIGAAVKGEAARQLDGDAGIETDTVAMLLARLAAGSQTLDGRTVLIVDEASTLGDRDLAAILRLADGGNATVRLIGDPAQHGSVPAGGSFTVLTEMADTPELTQVRRLLDDGERHRAELLRDGRISEALAQLESSGQLVLTETEADAYASMITRWYEHRQNGDPHPMVHGRNRERHVLNRLAQDLLINDGVVDADNAVTTRTGRKLCVGDEVIARHGDRHVHPAGRPDAWMRNGTVGTVIAIDRAVDPADDRITVQTNDGALECRREVFDRPRGGIDLAYAVTSYAVQGSTHFASTSAITTQTARSELYVDITRGRTSNQLYATRQPSPLEDDHLPSVESETVTTLQARLARRPGSTALAADPKALAIVAAQAERRFGAKSDDEIHALAAERHDAAIRRIARSDPPPQLRGVLPARPTVPHLAARWDACAGDLAIHLSRHPQGVQPRGAGLTAALGLRPRDKSGRTDWDDLGDQLVQLVVDITVRCRQEPAERGPHSDGSGAVDQELRVLARAGALANASVAQLRRLVQRIESTPSRHGSDAAEARNDNVTPRRTDPADDRRSRARIGSNTGGRGVA